MSFKCEIIDVMDDDSENECPNFAIGYADKVPSDGDIDNGTLVCHEHGIDLENDGYTIVYDLPDDLDD